MSRPVEKQSHVGATAAGPGEAFSVKGHQAIGLGVDASNLDSVNDTLEVRLEVEVGGSWLPIHDKDANQVGAIASGGLGSDGDAMLYISNVPAPRLRANITSFSDAAGSDLSVDTYVLATGRSGSGQEYET